MISKWSSLQHRIKYHCKRCLLCIASLLDGVLSEKRTKYHMIYWWQSITKSTKRNKTCHFLKSEASGQIDKRPLPHRLANSPPGLRGVFYHPLPKESRVGKGKTVEKKKTFSKALKLIITLLANSIHIKGDFATDDGYNQTH